MSLFHKIFLKIVCEDAGNITTNAFGVVGEYGNQFPSQNSKAHGPGDNRPIDPARAILGKKKSKDNHIDIQRRPFAGF